MQSNPVGKKLRLCHLRLLTFIYDVMQYYIQWDYSNPINGIVSQQDCTDAYYAQGEKHSHLLLDDIFVILSSIVEITRQHVHNHLSASVLYQWRRQNAEKNYAQQRETTGSSSDSHQLRLFFKMGTSLKGRNPVPRQESGSNMRQ